SQFLEASLFPISGAVSVVSSLQPLPSTSPTDSDENQQNRNPLHLPDLKPWESSESKLSQR
ncbi:hypothetical protein A2U01_0108533, partial [Trifolium medium]|nr:hypothetical protein [Trifolium medium]